MPRDSERYELVRVSKGMVEQLLAEEPRRVMLVGLERHDDETVELFFRTPDDRAMEALREIKRVAAIEAPPVSDAVPAKVWKIASDALREVT